MYFHSHLLDSTLRNTTATTHWHMGFLIAYIIKSGTLVKDGYLYGNTDGPGTYIDRIMPFIVFPY